MNRHAFVGHIRIALVAVLSAALTPTLGAQTPLTGYAPFTSRYRMVTDTRASQVMTGQAQVTESSVNQLTRVAITKDADGLALTITLDSMIATGSPAASMPDPSSAIGLTLSAAMAADGRVVTSTVTDKAGTPSSSPFVANLRSFLPRLKVGATRGMTWTDTSTTTNMQNGGPVTTTIISTYTLVGDTTVASTKNWKIVSTAIGMVSGSGNQGGADYTIKGDINGGGTFVVGAGGELVTANVTSDATMMVDVPMAGLQIPITQKQTTTITRVH